MWRRGWLLVIAVLGSLFPSVALAETSSEVTVIAVGWVVVLPPPTEFTATYLDDYTVELVWTKAVSANNTIIRVSDNAYPSSVTDGNEVYYGMGVSANDTAVNFYDYMGTKYYSAWSDNWTGDVAVSWSWSVDYITDDVESPIMADVAEAIEGFVVQAGVMTGVWVELLAFMLVVAIFALAFWQKNVFLYLIAVPVGLVYGLEFASGSVVGTASWVIGITVAIIGMFCLFRVVVDELSEIRRRKG